MPLISLNTTKTITKEAEAELRREFGEKIALLPGKTEDWLMLRFTDGCRMAFRGKAAPDMAMIEVSLLGSAANEAYEKLTAALTEVVSSVLKINTDMVYIKYSETEHWGWNGSNF